MPQGIPLYRTGLSHTDLARTLFAYGVPAWLNEFGLHPIASAVGVAMAASRELDQLSDLKNLTPSLKWMAEFLRFRSSVLVIDAPLRFVHPRKDGAVVHGHQVSLQLEFYLVASSSSSSLPNSPHGNSSAGPESDDGIPVFDYRAMVLRGGLQLCVTLTLCREDGRDREEEVLGCHPLGAPTCGPISEMLEVHWDGLAPGTYVAAAWVEYDGEAVPSGGNQEEEEEECPDGDDDTASDHAYTGRDPLNACCHRRRRHRSDPRPNPWMFEPTTREFRLLPAGKVLDEVESISEFQLKSLERGERRRGGGGTGGRGRELDNFGRTTVHCERFPDDSEWCHYGGAGVCLDLATSDLRLLDTSNAGGLEGGGGGGLRWSLGPEISRRRDEDRFLPAGHDQDPTISQTSNSSSSTSPWALPHRSAARAAWLSLFNTSAATTESHPMSSGADDDADNDADAPDEEFVWVRNTLGAFAFIDCPHNIMHQSTKLFQLSHALDHLGSSSTTAIVPLSCGRGPSGMGDGDAHCVPASVKSEERGGTSDWLKGIASTLFLDHWPVTEGLESSKRRRRRSGDAAAAATSVVWDPAQFALAARTQTSWDPATASPLPPTERPSSHRRQHRQHHNISDSASEPLPPPPLRFLCFGEAVVAGESRALFRGPADARKFRVKSRLMLSSSSSSPAGAGNSSSSGGRGCCRSGGRGCCRSPSEETVGAPPQEGEQADPKVAVPLLRQRPPRQLLVVQRPPHNRPIENLDEVLGVLWHLLLTPPPPPPPQLGAAAPHRHRHHDHTWRHCGEHATTSCATQREERGEGGGRQEDEEEGKEKRGNEKAEEDRGNKMAEEDRGAGVGEAGGGDVRAPPPSSSSSSSSFDELLGRVRVRVVTLEDMSFREQATLFSESGVVILAQGAAMANLVFLPEGAAVVELKQYGEYATQVRDIAAAAHLHHFAVRASALPPQALLFKDKNKNSPSTGCPGVRLPPSHTSGAPATFCPSMSFNSQWPVRVPCGGFGVNGSASSDGGGGGLFGVALADALAVTGLRPLQCECDQDDHEDNHGEGLVDEDGGAPGGGRATTGVNWWKHGNGGLR